MNTGLLYPQESLEQAERGSPRWHPVSENRSLTVAALFMAVLAFSTGDCISPGPHAVEIDHVALTRRAMETLKAAARYEYNPVVRVEAVEALESSGLESGRPWIRAAMLDEHPAVRFAACVAVGRLRDHIATGALRDRVHDRDASVQVAALFALHRLGHPENTGRIPTYLLEHQDVTVRRNAAMLLGLLDEPAAIKVLARAMRDEEEGVRQHALESMARLGNAEARQELAFMTNSGVGSEEVFAIQALAGTGDKTYADMCRYKLVKGDHLETRLAAARALGLLGSDDGFEFALHSIQTPRRVRGDPNDPPQGQRLRARLLAVGALGAIGRTEALPALVRLLDRSRDPRVQVAAARSILEILRADRDRALPSVSRRGGKQ